MKSASLLLLIVAGIADAKAPPSRLSIDHIILWTNDLDKGVREFERRTGVKPEYGGSYAGRGIRNALVSLGPGRYLEIMAPEMDGYDDDNHTLPREPRKPPPPFRMTPWGWAIQTHSAAALNGRLLRAGFSANPVGSDYFQPYGGKKTSWTSFQINEVNEFGNADGTLAYVVEWNRRAVHPSQKYPKGCQLRLLSIAKPRPTQVRRLIGQLGLQQVQIRRDVAAHLAFSLDCPKGRVNF